MSKYKTDYLPGEPFPLPRHDRHGIVNRIINDRYDVEVFDPHSGGLWYFTVDKQTGIRTYRAFLNKEQVQALKETHQK